MKDRNGTDDSEPAAIGRPQGPNRYPPTRLPMLPTISMRFAGLGSAGAYSSAFWQEGTAWCARGCDALVLVLRQSGITDTERVLIPTLHCPSIPTAMQGAGFQPDYYRVNPDLTPIIGDVAQKLQDGARALLLIHYFGFRQDAAYFRRVCDQHSAILIEDCAHTFFGLRGRTLPGEVGHYAIASARKLFPLPDGGAAISASGPVDDQLLRPVPWLEEGRRIVRTVQLAANFRRLGLLSKPISSALDYIDRARQSPTVGSDSNALPTSRDLHHRLASKPLMRTSRAARLLMKMTDVDRLTSIRRRNYLSLLSGVRSLQGCYPLFPDLPEDCVPYVFPLVLRDPLHAFPALKMRGVPIFRWEGMEGPDCSVADRYETQLIQLPCHQELGPSDIRWLLDQLLEVTEPSSS